MPSSEPEASEKVYGVTPPLTVIAPLLKGTPTSPVLVAEQMSCGPALTVKGQLSIVVVPLESTT